MIIQGATGDSWSYERYWDECPGNIINNLKKGYIGYGGVSQFVWRAGEFKVPVFV